MMGKKGHEAEVQWCDPRDGRTMAIAVAKGKRRKSPAGLASHCEFVLSRIGGGASLKGDLAIVCGKARVQRTFWSEESLGRRLWLL